LEALFFLLKQSGISILKAGIGNITKSDIVSAKSSEKNNPLDAVIVGFNVSVEEDALELAKEVKIITDEVIYKIIENLEKFRKEKKNEIERLKLMELAALCKLQILNQYVFRNSNPAIFGVKILAGKIKQNISLIDENDNEIARIKEIQHDKKSVQEAFAGEEVAISLPGINFDRQLKDINYLYSDLSEAQFKKFKENKNLLSQEEIRVLQEIANLKRKKKITWGV